MDHPGSADQWTSTTGIAYAISVHIPHPAHASAGLVLRESIYEDDGINKIIGEAMVESMFSSRGEA